MTTHGIDKFANDDFIINDIIDDDIMFELELDTFNDNINNLISLLINSVKKIVPF